MGAGLAGELHWGIVIILCLKIFVCIAEPSKAFYYDSRFDLVHAVTKSLCKDIRRVLCVEEADVGVYGEMTYCVFCHFL